MNEGCHPGIEDYDKLEQQVFQNRQIELDNPAAKAVSKQQHADKQTFQNKLELNDNSITTTTTTTTTETKETVQRSKTNNNRPIIGHIVEKKVLPSSIRPPNISRQPVVSQPKTDPKVALSSKEHSKTVPSLERKEDIEERCGPEQILYKEIDQENLKTIASMSVEEILEEQKALQKTLPTKLLEKWSNRQ